MAKWKIRPATAEDAELIKQIYKESRAELGSFNLYQCWDKYLSGENNEKFWMIDGINGFVRWSYSKKYGTNVVKDIGVLKSDRRSGQGEKLLKSVPCPVMLKCNEDNTHGNNFYRKMGMNKAGRTFTKSGKPQTIWTCVAW